MAVHQLADVLAYAHFAHELATECVDDAGDRGRLALADEVEVEHTLHGARLQATRGFVRLCSCYVCMLGSCWGGPY